MKRESDITRKISFPISTLHYSMVIMIHDDLPTSLVNASLC